MSLKKTWLGYFNFILASVFVSAGLIVLIYANLEYDMKSFLKNPLADIVGSGLNIPFWASLLIGVASICVLSQLYFLFRKFREFLCTKKGFFYTDNAGERIGGAVSFLIFALGLFFRVKAIVDKDFFSVDVKASINSINIKALFDINKGLSFSSFEDLYDSIVAFVYRFTGIKDSVYMWVNFTLHIVLILLIFMTVRQIYNAFIAIIPMLYVCLYPDNIKLVVSGGYENIERILVVLVLLLAVLFISLFKNSKHYNVLSLILSLIFEIFSLILLPMLIKNEITSLPVFKFEINERLYDFVLFKDWDFLCLTVMILIFIASLSFFFSDRDKLTQVFPLWVVVMVFFVFSESEWASAYFAAIITATFAGIGIDELLTSKIVLVTPTDTIKTYISKTEENKSQTNKPQTNNEDNKDLVQTELKTPKEIVIEKPIIKEINTIPDAPIDGAIPAVIYEPPTEVSSDNSTEINKKVELFESPLPLPKKHVKKEISYKFEPASDRMNFDIEIPEDDDFDI